MALSFEVQRSPQNCPHDFLMSFQSKNALKKIIYPDLQVNEINTV